MEGRKPAEDMPGLGTAARRSGPEKFMKACIKIAAAYLCLFLIFSLIFRKALMLSIIPSDSMADTLLPGDLILSSRLGIKAENISRYDILIFTLPGDPGQEYIKRVIGLPGETIEIRTDGKVYADGTELDDSFIMEPMEWYDDDVYVVPDGCYFFLGDNRNHSADSRYWDECVPLDNIEAKEMLKIANISFLGYGEE